jgi:non-canonical (house-cleaning) NTP pyrophosphatase
MISKITMAAIVCQSIGRDARGYSPALPLPDTVIHEAQAKQEEGLSSIGIEIEPYHGRQEVRLHLRARKGLDTDTDFDLDGACLI